MDKVLSRHVKIPRFVAIGVIAISALLLGLLIVSGDQAANRDFIGYWAAGRQLVRGLNPYDPAGVLSAERSAGYTGQRPNIILNAPNAFPAVLGLGLVSAQIADLIWLASLVAVLIISVRFLREIFGEPDDRLYLISYFFPPVVACIMAGQLGLFLLLGFVLFLRFEWDHPYVAGLGLAVCLLKPHLFVPFGLVLLLSCCYHKRWRILLGGAGGLLLACGSATLIDPNGWAQYARMMKTTAEVQSDFIPTVSTFVRILIDPNRAWLQFVPVFIASCWALGYFWRRRHLWEWTADGLLVLGVSLLCSPHAWLTDEAVLLPLIIVGLMRAQAAGKSLIPFGVVIVAALAEIFLNCPPTSWYYIWTPSVWLGLYLYGIWNYKKSGLNLEAGSPDLTGNLSI